jgi:hypothetical protein
MMAAATTEMATMVKEATAMVVAAMRAVAMRVVVV